MTGRFPSTTKTVAIAAVSHDNGPSVRSNDSTSARPPACASNSDTVHDLTTMSEAISNSANAKRNTTANAATGPPAHPARRRNSQLSNLELAEVRWWQ